MGCSASCCASNPQFDPQLKDDLVNGIEVAISEKKPSTNIEKVSENNQYRAQISQKKPETQEIIKAPASNTSLNNIKKDYRDEVELDKGNEIQGASETSKNEVKNGIKQQLGGGNKKALEKSNTSKAKLEENEDPKRADTKKSSQKTNEPNYHMIVGPEIFVSLKKGSILQQYEIGKTLGEGAFGKVSLVTHKTTKMTRAMKSMKKSSLLKEEEKKMFAEMNILKDLDHPNIVKLYELFQDDENYYLITEFCSGGELFDRIKSMTNFSEKIAAEYMKQILSAVVYCHYRKIVHRDLKPENLLFDSKTNGTIKVIDFGTSRKFDSNTKMTKRLGTPYYIAPEVLNKNYNEKCDVWSCGVILYILLCGYPPFTGKSEEDILRKVKNGKFHYDPEEWGKVSPEAKSLIDRMLTYDPEKRIAAQEALNDPWIQKNSINQPLSHKARTKLQAALYTFIATQILSQAEKSELEKNFKTLDKDGDGKLSVDELIEGYIRIYGEAEREKAIAISKKIISDVDQNYSGSIDFTEFLVAALAEDKLLNKTKIEQAFKMFDTDGDGFITKEELETIMGGLVLDETTWKAILEESDINKDGKEKDLGRGICATFTETIRLRKLKKKEFLLNFSVVCLDKRVKIQKYGYLQNCAHLNRAFS